MEDLGMTVSSNIQDALESVLHGKEAPDEREAALIKFIKDYDKSVNEYCNDLRARAVINKNLIVIVAALSLMVGAMITGTIMSL